MIMMPYGWTLDIAAAHRSGRLLAPRRCSRSDSASLFRQYTSEDGPDSG